MCQWLCFTVCILAGKRSQIIYNIRFYLEVLKVQKYRHHYKKCISVNVKSSETDHIIERVRYSI